MLTAHIICFSEEGSCILIGVKLKLNVLMAPLFHASLSIFRASNHRRWFPCIDWPQGKLVKLQAQCSQSLFEVEVKYSFDCLICNHFSRKVVQEKWFEKSGSRNLVPEIWFQKNGSSNLDFFLVREKWLLTRKKGGFIP